LAVGLQGWLIESGHRAQRQMDFQATTWNAGERRSESERVSALLERIAAAGEVAAEVARQGRGDAKSANEKADRDEQNKLIQAAFINQRGMRYTTK